MTNRKYILMFLLFCCIVFVSCNEKELSTKSEDDNQDAKITEIAIPVDTIIDEVFYKVDKISIKYPKVIIENNKVLEDEVNAIIEIDALKLVSEVENDEMVTILEIEYNLKRSDESVLSIQFVGYINSKGAPHPTLLAYTSNIDMNNGKKLEIRDSVVFDNTFIELYHNGKLTVMEASQGEFFESSTDEEILSMLEHAELYLTDGSLGLIVFVPYAVGDFSELEISFIDLKDILDNNVEWDSIIK